MISQILGTRSSVLTSAVLAGLVLFAGPVTAQAPSTSALAGKVTSQEEGAMEGVLVSAKRAGATMTITVVSDAQGQHSFPRDRLAPGKYSVAIRAVGYELPSPEPAQVEVMAQQAAALDLNLIKTKNLVHQLSNGEWLQSFTRTRHARKRSSVAPAATRSSALPILGTTQPRWPRWSSA